MSSQEVDSLINAIGNGEEDRAAVLAEGVLKKYTDYSAYRALCIEDLISGYRFDNYRLNAALSKIIAHIACNIDLESFVQRYGPLIKEHCRERSVRSLFPVLLSGLVSLHWDAEQLVQSPIFPYFLVHMADPENEDCWHMQSVLAYLIGETRNNVFIIEQSLASLASSKSNALVYARLLLVRFNLAIISGNVSCVKPVEEELFNTDDILLIANAIQSATDCVQQESNCYSTLKRSGFIDRIVADESLYDFSMELFLTCASFDSSLLATLEERGLFSNFDYRSHPVILQLIMLRFKESGDNQLIEKVCLAARNEVGAIQLNAVRAMSLLLSNEEYTGTQQAFIENQFPDIFDFIAYQIPHKGDRDFCSALYELAQFAVKKPWLIEKSLKSQRFLTFLLDRSLDPSLDGLREKYAIVQIMEQSPTVPSSLKAKLAAYLLDGVRGQSNPITNVASRTDQ